MPTALATASGEQLIRRLPYYALALIAFYAIYLVSLIGKSEGWLLDEAGRIWLNDFSGVWTAGHVAGLGAPEQAYDIAALCAEQARLRGAAANGCYPWPYPPHVLPLATGLSAFPFIPAMLFWLGFTGTLYAAVAWLLTGSWRGVALMLAGPATLNVLFTGQNGFLSAALLGAGLALLPARPAWAGVAMGLLAYKPHLGLMVPLALLAAGHWRAIGAAAATVLVLGLASVAIYGPALWHHFAAQLGAVASVMQTHFDVTKLRSAYGLLQTVGVPARGAFALHAVVAMAAAGTVVWAWRGRMAYDLKAALLATATTLASPYVFAYDLVLLSIAQAFLVRHALAHGGVAGPLFAGLAAVNVLQPLNGALAGLLLVALVLREHSAAPAWPTASRQSRSSPYPSV